VSDALAAIAADLSRLDERPGTESVVGMGGTSTNLAAIRLGLAEYDPDAVHGTRLELAELDRQIELFRNSDTEARRSIVGLQANRADVILAGACIARTILAKLRHESFLVSDRGLRHGLFMERFVSAPRG
jgi:exopolyphosphatase/guanosine-5'-triphosphate,3'-diphosphate pyrophosphatase